MLQETLNKYKKLEKKVEKNKNNNFDDDFLDEDMGQQMKDKCDEIMNKYCTLYTEIENSQDKYHIKPLNGDYLQKKQNRTNNLKTTGDGWFNMTAPIMTPELKADVKAIQLRDVIDPTRFYKKNDRNKMPTFFQIGTFQDNIMDGKRNRLKKGEVKERIAEEFLEADIVKNYSMKKFEDLQQTRRKLGVKKSKLNKYKQQSKKRAGKKDVVVK